MILTAALLLLMPQAALPQDAAKKGKNKAAKMICRDTDPPVGSHMRGDRVCMTAAEWQAVAQESHQGIDQAQGRRDMATQPAPTSGN